MSGLQEKLYTAKQVRRLDACAINEQGIAGYELMNRAGQAVVNATLARFPEAHQWMVFCGAGNNAGDGYVIARLAAKAGKRILLYAISSPEKLGGDARTAAMDWLQADGAIQEWPPAQDHDTPEVIIDALLGTGLDRPVEGDYLEAIKWMNAQGCKKVAVDIPSGLNSDTGRPMGISVQAGLTVSFIGLKQGLMTADGPDHCGELVFDSLSVPEAIYDSVADSGCIIREKLLVELVPGRRRNSHKGDYGHVLVLGGNEGMAGAARLAGEAALRSGSGLVTVATHPSHANQLNLARPELMVSAVSKARELVPLMEASTVLAAGPGMAMDHWARELFEASMDSAKPLVLDADGLNLLAAFPRNRNNWILTPHPAEAGRLLGTSTQDIQADRVASACALAERYQAVVILKGCGTVIAAPDGSYAICPLGNPGMATAGSGDVLTGIIASMLGRGLSAWDAAQAGVVAHAAAGDHCAENIGEHGMLAGDIIENLPGVLG